MTKKRLTIDSLIEKLQKAKKDHGGDVEVMLYEGDGAYSALDVEEAYMEIIPASNIYPEDKQFIIKTGEDTWE